MAKIVIEGRTTEDIGKQIRAEIVGALQYAWLRYGQEHDVVQKRDVDLGNLIEITFNAGTDDEFTCDLELSWSVEVK